MRRRQKQLPLILPHQQHLLMNQRQTHPQQRQVVQQRVRSWAVSRFRLEQMCSSEDARWFQGSCATPP